MEGVEPTRLQNLPNLLKMPSGVAGSQPRCPCHANTPALHRVSQRVKKADLLPDEGTVTRWTAWYQGQAEPPMVRGAVS